MVSDIALFLQACGPGNSGRPVGAGLTTEVRDCGCWIAGRRLRQARKVLGLTQKQMARTGIGPRYICRVERGQLGLTAAGLAALAEALEVSVAWLSGTED
jgi:hypothetical protein